MSDYVPDDVYDDDAVEARAFARAATTPAADNYTCASCGAVVAYEGELPDDCLRCGAPLAELDRDDWPVHQPAAPDAPIPGRHWYSGCNPDRPRVDPKTGACEDCGAHACTVCGREDCPDHPTRKEA